MLLAIFNLLPLPPLDGGPILVGVLPKALATPLMRLEPPRPDASDRAPIHFAVAWSAAGYQSQYRLATRPACERVFIDAILTLTGNR